MFRPEKHWLTRREKTIHANFHRFCNFYFHIFALYDISVSFLFSSCVCFICVILSNVPLCLFLVSLPRAEPMPKLKTATEIHIWKCSTHSVLLNRQSSCVLWVFPNSMFYLHAFFTSISENRNLRSRLNASAANGNSCEKCSLNEFFWQWTFWLSHFMLAMRTSKSNRRNSEE